MALDYDKEIEIISNLSKLEKYNEALSRSSALLNKFKTEEILKIHSNLLAWNGEVDKAILFLDNAYIDDPENLSYKLQKAKFLYWNKEYTKSYKLYSKIDQTYFQDNSAAIKFLKWYENYEKYKVKYSYSSDLDNKEGYLWNYFDVTYDNFEKFTIVLSHEREHFQRELNLTTNLLEIYWNDFYLQVGDNSATDYFIGLDYTFFDLLALGLKYNKYPEDNVYFYRIRYEKGISDFYFLHETNFIDQRSSSTNSFHKSKFKYKKILEYTQYYDFENSNKGELKLYYRLNKTNLGLGLYQDFNRKETGFIVEITQIIPHI
jgi:hypothetical protein